MTDPALPDLIKIGLIGPTHALSGAVRIRTIDDPEMLLGLKRVQIASRGWLQVKAWENHNAGLIVKLIGINSKETAEGLRNLEVFAAREELNLEAGRFFYHDLIGLPVRNPEGLELGRVEDVLDSAAQDLLSIARNGQMFLVPLQAPYVRVKSDHVEIDPIPGLLDSE
jgi:16S rRNA processing protein RimM